MEIQTPDEVMKLPMPISSLSLKSNAHRCPLYKTENLWQFLLLLYLWHLYTLNLYKHTHVQTHLALCSFDLHLISWGRGIFFYLANFTVTWRTPFLATEILYYAFHFSLGENQCEKNTEKLSEGKVFKITEYQHERGERGLWVFLPWNSTCFPNTPISIHKYPWQHLVSARRHMTACSFNI